MRDVNIRVIELQDHVLSMYDRQISNYTQKEFQRCGADSASSSVAPSRACL
jgi:NADH dehydrogenase FAD-containing subunit